MSKRTPAEELEYQMQKMKEMGVTMSFKPAAGRSEFAEDSPFKIIADAATAAGINEDTKEAN